jgi:hypothetical protein
LVALAHTNLAPVVAASENAALFPKALIEAEPPLTGYTFAAVAVLLYTKITIPAVPVGNATPVADPDVTVVRMFTPLVNGVAVDWTALPAAETVAFML